MLAYSAQQPHFSYGCIKLSRRGKRVTPTVHLGSGASEVKVGGAGCSVDCDLQPYGRAVIHVIDSLQGLAAKLVVCRPEKRADRNLGVFLNSVHVELQQIR